MLPRDMTEVGLGWIVPSHQGDVWYNFGVGFQTPVGDVMSAIVSVAVKKMGGLLGLVGKPQVALLLAV